MHMSGPHQGGQPPPPQKPVPSQKPGLREELERKRGRSQSQKHDLRQLWPEEKVRRQQKEKEKQEKRKEERQGH